MTLAPLRTAAIGVLLAGCTLDFPRSSPRPAGTVPVLEAGIPLRGSRPVLPDDPFRFKGESFTDLVQHTRSEIGADLEPDLSPDGKWLLFTSTRHDVEPDLYVKQVNGHTAIRKTFHPGIDCQGAFSPDGSRIAFCSNRNGDFDLFIMAAEGREPATALTQGDGDEMHPSWSPDGSKIAYCAFDARLGDWEVRVVDVATGAKTYLGINGLYPEWSPDGRQLAFQRARERGEHWYGIWQVTLATAPGSWQVEASNPTELIAAPDWGAVTPAWSGDSSRIVFVAVNRSGKGGAWKGESVWMVGRDGAGLVQLTRGEGAVSSPCWGSDERVYFVSDRSGLKSIWSLKPLVPEGMRAGNP